MESNICNRFAIASATQIDLSKIKPIKLEGEEQVAFERQMKDVLEDAYRRPVGRTGYGDYARVTVNGKTVATLSNEGFAETSNALGDRIAPILENNGSGPQLAQTRAEQIAKLLGGKVEKLPTAMTPQAWTARKPLETAVDFAAMARDGVLETWRRAAHADTALTAQMLGQDAAT